MIADQDRIWKDKFYNIFNHIGNNLVDILYKKLESLNNQYMSYHSLCILSQ